MDDLTQRLREGVVTSTYDGFVVIDPPTALTREAAARIDALEAEVARLRVAMPQPSIALSRRPIISTARQATWHHEDGSVTLIDQSGNGRHLHIKSE